MAMAASTCKSTSVPHLKEYLHNSVLLSMLLLLFLVLLLLLVGLIEPGFSVYRDLFAFANASGGLDTTASWGMLKTCDIYKGSWVKVKDENYYDSYPISYDSAAGSRSCPYVDQGFDCVTNGRPDSDYLKWMWMPYACHLPSDFQSKASHKNTLKSLPYRWIDRKKDVSFNFPSLVVDLLTGSACEKKYWGAGCEEL